MPANGNSDSYFISRVRRSLADQPVYLTDTFTGDTKTGGVGAGQKPFKLQRAPVVAANVSAKVAGGAQSIQYDPAVIPPAPANTAAIITETGEVVFNAVPAAGAAVLITYQAYRFSDTQVLDALSEGLVMLWPDIWQEALDSSLSLVTTSTEYALPAAFDDPRVVLMGVELTPPAGIPVAYGTGLWERIGRTTLLMEPNFPPGSVIRLRYNAKYATLAALEPDAMELPIYYACYRLAVDQETRRSRQNDVSALTGEGASQPGASSQVSQLWLDKFEKGKARLSMPTPVTEQVHDRSVERLFRRGGEFSWL